MASNTRKLAVEILGDASGAQKAMRAVEDSSISLSGQMGKVAKGIAGAFASQQIATFAKDAVGAALEDAKAQAELARQLKTTTGATDAQVRAVEDYISKTQNSTGILDDELRPALATFVRFTGNAKDAQDLLNLAMDVSTGTGKDLNTVSLALARAYAGNTGPLGRLGIATKDASGKALAFDEIQRKLNDTFGGATATAADTAAGKMKVAQAQFEDLKETVGTALIPVMGALVDVIKPVVEIFQALPEGVQNVITYAVLGAAAFKALQTTFVSFGGSASTVTAALGPLGVALAGVMIIGKIFAASSESNTKETEGFTTALKENDAALRASALNDLAANDPVARKYLETIGKLGINVDDLAQYLDNMTGPAANFRDAFSKIANTTQDNKQRIELLNDALGVNIDTTKMTADQAQATWVEFQNLQFALFNLEGEYRNTTAAGNAAASGLLGVALQGTDAADAIDEITGAAFELTEQWKKTLGLFDQKDAYEKVLDAVGKITPALDKAFGEPSQENLRAYDDAVQNTYESIADYIGVLGNVPEDVQTNVLALLDQGRYLEAVAALNALTTPKKVAVVPYVPGYEPPVGDLFKLPGLASGGPVSSNKPYIVGELGPELFVPSSAGAIIPNGATVGGGSNYNITVNASSVADTSAIGGQVVEAIRAYERRNGKGWRN